MATLTLTYDLDTESREAEVASKAIDLYFVLVNIDNYMRDLIKYRYNECDVKTVEMIREELYDILNGANLSLDMLP